MLASHVEPGTNLVELIIDGRITKQEFDRVLKRIEAVIAEHGEVCLLKHVRSLGSFPPTRIWADLEFALKHMAHIARVAVVADKRWMERMARMLSRLVPCEVRLFDLDELDEARAWLRAYNTHDQLKEGHIDEFHVTA